MGEAVEVALLCDIELTYEAVLFAGDTGLITAFAGVVSTSASISTLPGFSNIAARFLTEKDMLNAVLFLTIVLSQVYSVDFNAFRRVLELKGDKHAGIL